MRERIEIILALPRSLYWNIRIFGRGGVRLPLLISVGVQVKGLRKGSIEMKSKNFAQVRFGFGGSLGVPSVSAGTLAIGAKGRLCFRGKAVFSRGTTLRIDDGTCIVGDDFYCNANCQIFCNQEISFGDKTLLGWNVEIRDADGHHVYQNGVEKLNQRPIRIGNHVWLAAGVNLLKGAAVADYSVVGCKSCVTKAFDQPHALIAGVPAKIIQEDIDWEK